MNKSINSILFNNLSKFSIPQNPIDIEYENINMALSVNRNLGSYGYTLSTDAISALAKLPAQEICGVYNDLTDIIKEYKGIDEFNSVELFYPNFPEEVMDKSEEALYINSLLYYTFSQTDDERCKTIAQMIRDSVTEEKVNRLPLLENFPDKLKVINNTNIKELDELMINRIHAPKGMNEENLKDVETYFREYPFKIDQIVSTETSYQSKENLVKTASLLYKLGARNSAVNMIKDSKDVLRFAAELSNQNFGSKVNDISLNTKKTVSNKNGKVKYKLTNSDKRLIKDMLNNCPNLYYDIWKDEGLYKRLMNRIDSHTGPERVVKAFDNLANKIKKDENGKDIIPVPRQFEKAIDNLIKVSSFENVQKFNKLADNFPGYFVQHYIQYVDEAAKEDNGLALTSIANKIMYCNVPVQSMLTMYNSFELRNKEHENRIYKNKNGKLLVSDNKPLHLSDAQMNNIRNIIRQTIVHNISDTKQLGKVYIDPKLEDIKIPLRDMRDCSAGNIITPYSKLSGNQDKNLLAYGIYWKNYKDNNGHEVRGDIDLSVKFYNDKNIAVDTLYYYNLKSGKFGVHSGDYTDAPNGATEMVLLDKKAMKDAGIKYAVVEIHGFSVPFNKAEGLKFIEMEKEGSLGEYMDTRKACHRDHDAEYDDYDETIDFTKDERSVIFLGKQFEISQIEHPIKINAASTMATPCVYDVENDVTYWIDHVDSLNLGQNVVSNDLNKQTSVELGYILNNAIPDMKQLFDLYAEGCGELTADIKEADTVFSLYPLDVQKEGLKENAKVVSSYDLDYISNEFCGKSEKLDNPVANKELEKETVKAADELDLKNLSKVKHKENRIFDDELEL